jgi:hypothetical protein
MFFSLNCVIFVKNFFSLFYIFPDFWGFFPEFFLGYRGPYLIEGIIPPKTRQNVTICRGDTGEGGGSIPTYGRRGDHITPLLTI